MTIYWLTFRIAERTVNGFDDGRRRQDLYDAVQIHADQWWLDPTSFIAFESGSTIDDIAGECRDAIAPAYDMVLIREMDTKSARIIGLVADRDIFKLMPYLKEA